MLFYGKKGVGKFLTAKLFAQWIIHENVRASNKDRLSKNNKNLYASYISNVYEINTNENETFGVGELRKIMNEMNLTNTIRGEKVVIIDNFDTMNINSKNALLKNLEEPKREVIIILVCHNIFRIPKTVLSRCVKLNFNELSREDFNSYILENYPDIKNNQEYFEFCDGRPGLLTLIKNLNIKDIYIEINDIVKKKQIDYERLFKISEKYKKDPYLIDFLIKNYLFKITKEKLLNNLEDLHYFKKVSDFYVLLNKKIIFDLNLDIKNYISLLFLSFIKTLKT